MATRSRWVHAANQSRLLGHDGGADADGQGFVQFDIGDEEDSGRMGTVARKEKEIREHEKRTLSGLAGRSLYLEALQLIIRSQVLWLVRVKGMREELETVVRDLWDLRVRAFGTIMPEEQSGDGASQLETFSSQPLSDDSDGGKKQAFGRHSWDSDRGSDWPTPKVSDSLALCYLGCLLLRIPLRIGQLFTWADQGHIPYRRAVRCPSDGELMVQYVIKALFIAVFRLASRNSRPSAVYLHTESQAAAQHTSQVRRSSPSNNKSSHWLSHKLQFILPRPEFSIAARSVHEALGSTKYGFPIVCCI
jgi:hypothetical protein